MPRACTLPSNVYSTACTSQYVNKISRVLVYVEVSVDYSIAGYRIGKGEGYADLEFAMMMKMGAVDQNTVIAATVHDCQVHIYIIFSYLS
jgi:5-formyltetrahydrofolate cyclo-ligase